MKATFMLMLGCLSGVLLAQQSTPAPADDESTATESLETAETAPVEPTNPPSETPSESAEEPLDEPDGIAPEDEFPTVPEATGVEVEVSGEADGPKLDASSVKLLAPFPAKPLSPPPPGWRIIQPDNTPAFTQQVELGNGTLIDLSIRPHLLVPDADGSQVFALEEPGFDHALGYAQKSTVGSILADTIRELDENGARLEQASQQLSELLDSLPAEPQPKPQPAPEEATASPTPETP